MGGNITYYLSDSIAVVKPSTRMTWESSLEFKTLLFYIINELRFNKLFIDLSETTHIDSTILGVIVHTKKNQLSEDLCVVLSSPTKECEALLNDVGLHKVFEINKKPAPVMSIAHELPLGQNKTIADIELLIKEAHQELIQLNDRNRKLFSSVIDTFENFK
jgi:anti-anti-sigma factor